MRKRVITTLFLVLSLLANAVDLKSTSDSFNLKITAVRIIVPDLQKAITFYKEVFGFSITTQSKTEAIISTNSFSLILSSSKNANSFDKPGIGNVSVTFQVKDIKASYKKFKSLGVRFEKDEIRTEGIGYSLKIYDPFGNHFSILQDTLSAKKEFDEPCKSSA
ncbi:MAG: VOC family protein [Sphingobacteriaceae bacterium]|nr:VOC family protein [Sphingobacteriaceae bacterium]